ncbi:MAG: PQQ-dependent dehydrogenase, methanol/ethanol family [Caulobacteraceae bacterium]
MFEFTKKLRLSGRRRSVVLASLAVPVLAGMLATSAARGRASDPPSAPTAYGRVDLARLLHADREPEQWFTSGRDNGGGYYSPLTQINDRNVARLGFAWEYRTHTQRGLEATPVVVDGVMYTSGAWGAVYALNAVTGAPIWTFNPQAQGGGTDGQAARYACCDVVNRGVAVRDGKVYVASLDGRLFALDARTGKVAWQADTIADHRLPYTVSGAPQLTRDLVVIGNAGADIGVGGVRGYASAYDLRTGQLRWRFYTVPRPGDARQTSEMRAASRTWDPRRDPRFQGGGTVWDGMAYDPDLDLVYLGVGNASPYNVRDRSPNGGDNLYLSSIVAVSARTGRMAWHYQTTPGDNWDYGATQKLVLADLPIGGKVRKVIMQAPKNGYFYVLDRGTGKPISAKPYTYQNWSSGLDKHFRPIFSGEADYTQGPKLIYPFWGGGHDWQPMSYDPRTGLVYIPVLESPMIMIDLKRNGAAVDHIDGLFGTAILVPDKDYRPADWKPLLGDLPKGPEVNKGTGQATVRAVLKAWDPVRQTMVWSRQSSVDYTLFDGGVMSTAGNLVFQGQADGKLQVYAADSGKLLKTIETGTGIMAAPSTYTVDGVQYVAVMAGYGGAMIGSPFPPSSAAAKYENAGRVLVFRLDGAPETPKPPLRTAEPFQKPPLQVISTEQAAEGGRLYAANCGRCHHFGVSIAPDLRRFADGTDDLAIFRRIVLDGLLAKGGMGAFKDTLTPKDVEAIHAYLVDEAEKIYRDEQARAKPAAASG